MDFRLKLGGRIMGKEEIENVGLVVDIGYINMAVVVNLRLKISH